jgi:hypothetical protein
VRNEEHYSILMKLEQAVYQLGSSDKVLFYFAGHGKRSRRSGLPYLVASNTISEALNATGIAVDTILRILRESNCRQRLLILDCCHSGAVGEIFRGSDVGDSIATLARSTGTYILTASTGIQTAAERETDVGDGGSGVFTRFLVEGLETGEAQTSRDGEIITVDDLYDYVRAKVIINSPQEPQKYVLDGAGTFNIARSPAAKWNHRRREALQRFASMLQENVISQDELAVVLDLTKRRWAELDSKERADCCRLLQVLDGDGTFSVVSFFASLGSPTRAPTVPEQVTGPLSAKAPTESRNTSGTLPLNPAATGASNPMFMYSDLDKLNKRLRRQFWTFIALLAATLVMSAVGGWLAHSLDWGASALAHYLDWGGPDLVAIKRAVDLGSWFAPIFLLFIVAWVRFNTPATNRSGTTFSLFFLGVIFYYALIIALWLLVAIAIGIPQGSILQPGAQSDLDQYKPILAALIVVVASQFPAIDRIDRAARSFCMSLAGIPVQADLIAVELTRSDFLPKSDRLRDHIAEIISENIGVQALKFARDFTDSARFTRAVGLYWLFIAPKKFGTQLEFPAGHHARAAYAEVTQLAEPMVRRSEEGYEELMRAALDYFASAHPTKEAKDGLSRAATDVSNLVCSLIARYVLYCDKTALGRRQRLSNMGFDASRPVPSFGLDQWAMTVLAVMLLSVAVMTLTPGRLPIAATKVLSIAITFALSIGCAVMGAILVAQRFIERRANNGSVFPPFAELILAGLIVTGLSLVLRIAIPLIPALLQRNSSGVQDVITQFTERWPGIIVPFTCTISLGLLCSYLGRLEWSWPWVSIVAAIGNGFACMAAGFVLAWLLSDATLTQFYEAPGQATAIIVANTGLIGAAIGAIVLAAFRRSERLRKDVAERARLSILREAKAVADELAP